MNIKGENRKSLCIVLIIVLSFFMYIVIRNQGFWGNTMITASCILSVICTEGGEKSKSFILALFVSIVADFAMKNTSRGVALFMLGMILFFIAHLLLISYFKKYSRKSKLALLAFIGITISYFVWYIVKIMPNIHNDLVKIMTIGYIIISAYSVASVIDLDYPICVKLLMLLGIGCIVVSDTIIAQSTFVDNQKCKNLINPLYSGCHYFLTIGVLLYYSFFEGLLNLRELAEC